MGVARDKMSQDLQKCPLFFFFFQQNILKVYCVIRNQGVSNVSWHGFFANLEIVLSGKAL